MHTHTYFDIFEFLSESKKNTIVRCQHLNEGIKKKKSIDDEEAVDLQKEKRSIHLYRRNNNCCRTVSATPRGQIYS